MSYQVIDPFLEFTNPVNGQPIGIGSVYFGRPDSDPKNQPSNRINVYAVQDNGTEVLLSQPITLNAAGQPQYNGSPKQLRIELAGSDTSYCVQVLDKKGAQKLYTARVVPAVDVAELGASGSIVPIAGVPAWKIALTATSYVNVKAYGAKGDGVTDDTAAMASAHATGKTVYYPAGVYLFSRLTAPITAGGIVGDGQTETILQTTDTGVNDVMVFSGLWENFLPLAQNSIFMFRDFGFVAPSAAGVATKTGGALIKVTAPISGTQRENQSSVFENVFFQFAYTAIHFFAASLWKVRGCTFNSYARNGVLIENRHDADSGDGTVHGGCVFVTNPTPSGAAAVRQYSSGGFRFSDSKVLGGTYGYSLEYDTTATVGAKETSNLHIINVSFELMQYGAINLTSNGVKPFKLIQINSCHIALTSFGVATDSTTTFSKVVMTGNNIEVWNGYSPATAFCIGLNNVSDVNISGNNLIGILGTSVAVSLLNCTGKLGTNVYSEFLTPLSISGGTVSVQKDVQSGVATSGVTGWAAYGSLFRSGLESVTFPVAYKVAPSISDVTLTAGDGTASVGGIVNTVSNTGFTYFAIGTTSAVATNTRWQVSGIL